MLLQDLAALLPAARILGAADTLITSITQDSRQVQQGALFVAVVGYETDGHRYIADAVSRGAAAVMVEHPVVTSVPQLVVRHTQPLIGHLAAAMYGYPSEHIHITAVTGTKGKTSTCLLLDHLLRCLGYQSALLGSLGGRIAGKVLPATLTTRPPCELQELLHQALTVGERHLVMEVGSHSLVQKRMAGISFDTVIFTNLAHEHLDYHGTMERYLDAKAQLFSWLGSSQSAHPVKGRKVAVLNQEDASSSIIAERIAVPFMTYGITPEADLWADTLLITQGGSRFTLHWEESSWDAYLPLLGRFNVQNALAALSGGLVLGLPLSAMVEALPSFAGVSGRFEPIDRGQPFQVIVDYAHTEDSLRLLLQLAREVTKGRIILVFGCTGDRDRSKRAPMGAVATALADKVILSSDDPHKEDPEAIIAEIVQGIPANQRNWSSQADRTLAVREAITLAQAGDMVILAGKGHEQVMIFGDYSVPYSDQETARQALRNMGY